MFQILTTPQSRVGAVAVIVALFLTPLANALLGNTVILNVANYLIAVLVGCGLGWVAGDAFTQSNTLGKVITLIGSVAVTAITIGASIYKALQQVSQIQQGSLLYELFIQPLRTPTFLAALQYGILAFIIVFFLAIFYIQSKSAVITGVK